jgi:tRNA(His) 5'-end guanylyltransferase
MDNSNLGIRMKGYENIAKTKLMRRTPVAIRIDGKAFHTFTRNFKKPFDEVLIKSMQDTMKYLCENIQGCVLGYTQSDEITLILVDYKQLNTSAWFDNEVQKMTSISASMATMAFNKAFAANVQNKILDYKTSLTPQCVEIQQEIEKYHNTLRAAVNKGAMFDSRVFNIPKEEVTNLILWRQFDATRNSIQMVGQANFSHKELQNKSCNQIQDMLHEIKGINWNDYPTTMKRGSCCIKKIEAKEMFVNGVGVGPSYGEVGEGTVFKYHCNWTIDNEIPIFKNEGREYIDKLVDI